MYVRLYALCTVSIVSLCNYKLALLMSSYWNMLSHRRLGYYVMDWKLDTMRFILQSVVTRKLITRSHFSRFAARATTFCFRFIFSIKRGKQETKNNTKIRYDFSDCSHNRLRTVTVVLNYGTRKYLKSRDCLLGPLLKKVGRPCSRHYEK